MPFHSLLEVARLGHGGVWPQTETIKELRRVLVYWWRRFSTLTLAHDHRLPCSVHAAWLPFAEESNEKASAHSCAVGVGCFLADSRAGLTKGVEGVWRDPKVSEPDWKLHLGSGLIKLAP